VSITTRFPLGLSFVRFFVFQIVIRCRLDQKHSSSGHQGKQQCGNNKFIRQNAEDTDKGK
jgi:hypothetical protein